MVDPTQPPDYAGLLAVNQQRSHNEQRLQGIFIKENARFAVIDNQVVALNDSLTDGSKVLEINAQSVKLTKLNNQVESLLLPSSVIRDEN